MSPKELIILVIIGSILVIVLAIIWFLFWRRKKIALIVTILTVLGFGLFFTLRPLYIKHEHAERYQILTDYLHKQYPNYKFAISPKVLEDGYTPYEYQVVANGYKYRNEYFRVDNDGSVMFASFSAVDSGTRKELDYLLLNTVYEKPFEYIEGKVELKEITRYEGNDFLLRLMNVNGKPILYNYLKKEGQFFLEQTVYPNQENNYIELKVSPDKNETFYVLATLPGFNKGVWENTCKFADKIDLHEELPAIYVVLD